MTAQPQPDARPSPGTPVGGREKTVAVLFADIAGSTKLYDTLGDALAKRLVDECIALMSGIVAKHGGRVVKTIGDEVMCVLPDADSGCLAAVDMQVKVTELPAVSNTKRAIRAGFHAGPVIEENNDVFGDTVNLAARMSGVAKAMQIMTTRSTVEMLSPLLRTSSRPIAALSLKGKGVDVEVCEIIWQSDGELTTLGSQNAATSPQAILRVRYGNAEIVLDRPNSSLILGRDASCNVAVLDRMASRVHARIEHRRDKFYLIDQSTNGTYVVFEGEPEIALRREEVMLRGEGRIAFGRSVGQSSEGTAWFAVRA